MNRLQNKVAIVTGANSGIGLRTAQLFAEEGAILVLCARRKEKLDEVAKALRAQGSQVLSIAADVSREEDCVRVVEEAVKAFGRVDVLVNNAGMADKHRPITRCDGDWWHTVIDVNQNSVYYMMKAALKYMELAGYGSIVNIASIGATRYNSGVAYTASKTAVIGMSKNVAIQFAGKGIRVNVVCPGPTPTALNTPEQLATFDQEFAAQCGRHMDGTVPEVSVDDQAHAILFFASDEAKGVNGQVLTVDNPLRGISQNGAFGSQKLRFVWHESCFFLLTDML